MTMNFRRQLLALSVACLSLAPFAAARVMAAESLPAGAILAPRALDASGTHVLAVRRSGAGCGSLERYSKGASGWQKDSTFQLPGGNCPPFVAAGAGKTAVLYEFGADRALVVDGSSLKQAARLSLTGEKAFANPPPPGAAVSPSGDAILLGAMNYVCKYGVPLKRCGTATLYLGSGSSWHAAQTLEFPEGGPFNIEFGRSVAVSDGGDLVAVGGPGKSGDQGEVYLFERQGGQLRQTGVLVPDERSETYFGTDIAFSADGKVIAVGGDQAVYLFARDQDGWAGLDRVAAPEARAGYFGAALALSADGSRLLVGAPRANCKSGQSRCGAAYLFERTGRSWKLARGLDAPTPTPDTDFGYALALDAKGRKAAIQGKEAYLFDLD